MKRKVLSVILTGAMVAGLAGTVTVHAEEQKTYNIGICQLVQHEALDAATQGFEDAVKEGLGEENVTFDEQNAQGDSATCSTIINNFVSSNVDLILANATASLQAAAAGTSDIPILGTAVTEYGVALDLTDFDGTVGGNISGTSDLAPLDQQAAMLNELFPDAKTVGLLYCSAEPLVYSIFITPCSVCMSQSVTGKQFKYLWLSLFFLCQFNLYHIDFRYIVFDCTIDIVIINWRTVRTGKYQVLKFFMLFPYRAFPHLLFCLLYLLILQNLIHFICHRNDTIT